MTPSVRFPLNAGGTGRLVFPLKLARMFVMLSASEASPKEPLPLKQGEPKL